MHKETSNRVSSIASRLIHITPATIIDASDKGHSHIENLCEDVKTLAASALGQDEHAGQDKPDFFARLKDEREDLDRRLAALNSYLTHNPGRPNPAHYEMLKRQAASMSDYLTVLDERIADIEKSKSTTTEHDL